MQGGAADQISSVWVQTGDGSDSEEPDTDWCFCLWLYTLKDDDTVCSRRIPEAIQLKGAWRTTPITAI